MIRPQSAVLQKKETLERFAYCNSQQLFQNSLFDLRSFIKQNYEKYCELVDKVEHLKQQGKNKCNVKSKVNLCVKDDLTNLKKQIEQKQLANNELKQQLQQLTLWTKKQDFFQEYQEICKSVEELRVQNDQLLKR